VAEFNRLQAVARMRLWSNQGLTSLPPDNIGVQGHCVGAVGRAFLGHSAGFADANLWADKAAAAGILRKGNPVFGDIVVFKGRKYGHVGVATDARSYIGVDKPKTGRIGVSRRSQVWTGLRYVGFIRPEDMHKIGWPVIPAAPAPLPHTTVPVKGKSHYVLPGQVFKGTLRMGSKGAFVREVQFHLGRPVTGVYSSKDVAAVKAIQKRRWPLLGKADGIAGPRTYRTVTGHK
jgi:hypothetical protein